MSLWVGSVAPSSKVSIAKSFSELVADSIRPLTDEHAGGADLTVYNVFGGAEVATFAGVGSALGSMAVSSDGSTLCVVDETPHTVLPIDLATRTVGTGWPLGVTSRAVRLAFARPGGVGVLVAGSTLRRASDGTVFSATFASAPGGGLSANRDPLAERPKEPRPNPRHAERLPSRLRGLPAPRA